MQPLLNSIARRLPKEDPVAPTMETRLLVLAAIVVLIGLYFWEIYTQQTLGAPGVTAVLLNWKRLDNNVRIVAELCKVDTIAQIRIWNNNPSLQLHFRDFASTGCSEQKIWIHNSPQNVLFLARYIACASSYTRHCFIQDDDYLVRAPVIQALYLYLQEATNSDQAIHLLAPDAHLSTALLSISTPRIHTSFAWLGYGTIVARSRVRSFLSLLHHPLLDMKMNERHMADNYFSMLGNRIPTIWIDQGEPLHHNDAFTVGTEGDDRNWLFAQKALDRLITVLDEPDLRTFGTYTDRSLSPRSSSIITRAPCLRDSCVVETNILLLPNGTLPRSMSEEDARNVDFKETFLYHSALLGSEGIERYVRHSLSALVDGDYETSFRSPKAGQKGDYISYDMLRPRTRLSPGVPQILLLPSARDFLHYTVIRTSLDGITWVDPLASFSCHDSNKGSTSFLMCSFVGNPSQSFRYVRMQLERDVDIYWEVLEIGIAP